MNLAIGGSYLGYPADATINSNTVFPGEIQVDYVRVYTDVPTTNAPGQVTGLNASASSSSVYLNWNASDSGATAYNVKRSTTSGGPYTTIGSITTNSFADTPLASCSTYYYVVSGTNAFGESTNSLEVAATLPSYSLAVNSGGSVVNQFLTDAYFSGGTQAAPTTTTIDTSAVAGAAPQTVYQSERYGNFTYTFSGLASRSYLLRLHFAEFYWTAAGQREFNVSINGTQVLTNFDIVAAAGGPNKAIVKQFNVFPNSGSITVQYTTVIDNAKSSGIELLLMPPSPPTGLQATAGDSSVALTWVPPVPPGNFNVQRATAFAGPYLLITNGLSVTNFTDTSVTNGTLYYYVVSDAINGCEGANSAPVAAIPICSAPATPVASNNGPIYVGMTLSLTASSVAGASYSWTGPNAFTSTNQNPTIANAQTNASGAYGVTVTVGSCSSAPGQTTVTVNPLPSIGLQSSGGNAVLTWSAGTLQSSTNIPGNWEDVMGATSPYTNPPAIPQIFYRLKLP